MFLPHLFYIIKKQTTTEEAFFISKSFNITRKPVLLTLVNTKKAIWRNLLSIQSETIYWLLCLAKSCDWSRKITPPWSLNRAVAFRRMKLDTYSIKYKFWRKCWKQFLSSEQLSLDVALNIAGVEKIRSENLRLRSTLEAIRFAFWMKGALVTVEICVPCCWRFLNQFDHSVGVTL